MRCRNCGAETDNRNGYCPYCGARLTDDQANRGQAGQYQQPQNNQGYYGNQQQNNQGYYGNQQPQNNQGYYGNQQPQNNQGYYGNQQPQNNQGYYGNQQPQNNQGYYGNQQPQNNRGYNGQYAAGGTGSPVMNADMPMKWHKFLIYFAIIAGGVVNIIYGINYITGRVYLSQGIAPELFYDHFPSLKIADVMMGIAMICLAVYCFYTWSCLKKLSKKGVKCLLSLYLISMALNVIYGIVVGLAIRDFSILSVILVLLVVLALIMYFANKKYYEKRSHLLTD